MGQTYVAEDTQRPGNPKCVVKQLKPACTGPNCLVMARRLFSAEAEILEKLGSHEQIPRLLAYFEQDEEFYLVQEYIEGHPLSSEIILGRHWSEFAVIRLLHEVLQILEFVHRHNVIHRDIKPSNIIRRRQDNKLVLIDFGAVKQVRMPEATTSEQASLTVVIGTPGYMPTEQSSGKPRPSSDLYALGMVAIQALTGLMPNQLPEDEDGELIWRDQAVVSDAFAEILNKMVRHYFKHRYQAVTEVLASLEAPIFAKAFDEAVTRDLETFSHPATPLDSDAAQENSFYEDDTPTRPIPIASPYPLDSLNPSPIAQSPSGTPLTPSGRPMEIIQLPDTSSRYTSPTVVWYRRRSLQLSAIILAVVGLGGFGGYQLFRQSQHLQQQGRLEEIRNLQKNDQFEDCIEQIGRLPFPQDTAAATVLGQCQLSQAQQFAQRGRLADAIVAANAVDSDHPDYAQTQKQISQWSERILQLARVQYWEGNFDAAEGMVNVIPSRSPLHQKAQDTLSQWRVEWRKNDRLLRDAQIAQFRGQWQTAINIAYQVTTPFWQKRADEIIRGAAAELSEQELPSPPQNWRVTPDPPLSPALQPEFPPAIAPEPPPSPKPSDPDIDPDSSTPSVGPEPTTGTDTPLNPSPSPQPSPITEPPPSLGTNP
jgi:serine/threonine-protein kinase